MSFFYEIVTHESPVPPAEVEKRLGTIVRTRRTLLEVLCFKPVNPPENPDFIGWVGGGRFKIRRIVESIGDDPHSRYYKAPLRGWITPSAQGSRIRILFCDPVASVMVVILIMGVSFVVLANTGGRPLWRIEHAVMVLTIAGAAWFCRFWLAREIERSMSLIRACVD